jgi:Ni,Fe-hydrogenase III small subunit/Pyruvate/2-oxoacid:ferredoxin oxidoreductase delta subunit
MFDILKERYRQKNRTMRFPPQEPTLPERYRGRPVFESLACGPGCGDCVNACPTSALCRVEGELRLDLSRCIFCAECSRACGRKVIRFTREFRLAAAERSRLVLKTGPPPESGIPGPAALDARRLRCFKRSLKLRQVSAGGCNACEADVNVLNTVTYDLGRFGIEFTASPRHADGILVTGPVTKNMRRALLKTYEAVPTPRVVIAVGACALSGGLFYGHDQVINGADSILPVDLFIPGCPPHPLTILDGLLRLLGKL